MPEIMGSGCALFDYDDDGRLDIYLVQNGGPDGPRNQLFHQEKDGTFNDVSAGSGLDVAGWGMGVAVADVNNDGYSDVLVTEYGRLRLFLNCGNGTFRDVTEAAGLAGSESADAESEGGDAGTRRQEETPTFPASPRPRVPASVSFPVPASASPPPWYTSAAFFDYDRDGWLDLVVTQYIVYDPERACADKLGNPDYCGPSLFPGAATRLYHNLGGFGVQGSGFSKGEKPNTRLSPSSLNPEPRTLNPSMVPLFQDVTAISGLAAQPGPGLGVICLDFDGDSWPDIFVSNDGKPNQLWINRHNGTFVDEAARRGLAFNAMGQTQGNMGIAVGDINGDGQFDLFVTHLTEETHTLYIQRPVGMFADESAAWGLANAHFRATGFGAVFADFDNSGQPGLAIANGRVVRANNENEPGRAHAPASLPAFWQLYAERNSLFANDGHGKFRDLSDANPDFCAQANVGRSLAQGDLDNDGGIDLLLTTAGGDARLFHNIAGGRGHWLQIRAVEPKLGGRDAIGAEVTIEAAGRAQVGYVNSGGSYLASSDPRVHFGLGEIQRIESIRVRWPDGMKEIFPPTGADQMITLKRGTGTARNL